MRFRAEIEGFEVVADVSKGFTTEFWCTELNLRTDSPEKIEDAIRRHILSLRKGFKNETAFIKSIVAGECIAEQVTVTSLDADGVSAWVRKKSGREKVFLKSLFASADAVMRAISFEQEKKKEIADAWTACARWSPVWPDGHPAKEGGE